MLTAFRLLAGLKGLRGTAWDPFGRTAERRTERRLITDYEALVADLLTHLSPATHATAVALAALPQKIRGYGHVKDAAIAAAKADEVKLLAELRAFRHRGVVDLPAFDDRKLLAGGVQARFGQDALRRDEGDVVENSRHQPVRLRQQPLRDDPGQLALVGPIGLRMTDRRVKPVHPVAGPGGPFRLVQQLRLGELGLCPARRAAIDDALLDIIHDVAPPILGIGGDARLEARRHLGNSSGMTGGRAPCGRRDDGCKRGGWMPSEDR
jgi:hypothetical protein